MENLKIEVRNRIDQFLTDIFIARRGYNGKIIVYLPKGGGIVEEKEFDLGNAIPPTLTIPSDFAPLLMDALKREGVRLPDESFTKGKLDATEAHLKDLRQLLKLK